MAVWILAADSSRARLLQFDTRTGPVLICARDASVTGEEVYAIRARLPERL